MTEFKYKGIRNNGCLVKGKVDAENGGYASYQLRHMGIWPLSIKNDDNVHIAYRLPKKAVYAGSFDPLTFGHIWVIKYGLKLFDELIIAVGENPDKKYTFSLEERLKMIDETIDKEYMGDYFRGEESEFHLGSCYNFSDDGDKKIMIEEVHSSFSVCPLGNRFLVDLATEIHAQFILRGMRNESDFVFEQEMAHFNSEQECRISTIWAPCPRHLTGLSSSMVKGLCGPKYWEDRVRDMVPEPVFKRLVEWQKEKDKQNG
jgi:pantetheine-phosphate adenylyltransferase